METNGNTNETLYKISAADIESLKPALGPLNFIVRIQDIDESTGMARLSLFRSDIEIRIEDLEQVIAAPQDKF